MIKAILLDLDNTLLINDDIVFARTFLRLLDEHFGAAAQITDASVSLRRAIKALKHDRDSRQTNQAVITTILAEDTGLSESTITTHLKTFFEDVYPALASCVSIQNGASKLLETLFEQDCAVVIATNPLYPVSAIQQRMQWAALPHNTAHYDLITGTDNMHFVKPDPAYYAEILARLGIEPDEALMVGDGLKNDIYPAQQIGIQTWYLYDDPEDIADCSGSLADLLAWLQQENWQHRIYPPRLQPDAILPQFQGNIAALYGLLDNTIPADWHKRPDPNEWSILQILCHLLDSEHQVQLARLQHILTTENPFIVAPSPPGLDMEICAEDAYDITEKFVQARYTTIQFLADLSPDEWQRPAKHSIFGNTTLLEMVYFTAQHDRLHIEHLCQTIGRCHQDE